MRVIQFTIRAAGAPQERKRKMEHETVTAPVRKSKTYALAMTALAAAVICVISPFAIPVGPISLSDRKSVV